MRTPVVAEARPTHTLAGDLLDRARRHAVEFTTGDGPGSC